MPCKVGNVPCFLSVKNHVACSTLLKNQSEPIRKKGARIKFIMGLLLSTVFFLFLALIQKIRVYSKKMRQFANSHIILPYPSIKMAAEKKAML